MRKHKYGHTKTHFLYLSLFVERFYCFCYIHGVSAQKRYLKKTRKTVHLSQQIIVLPEFTQETCKKLK